MNTWIILVHFIFLFFFMVYALNQMNAFLFKIYYDDPTWGLFEGGIKRLECQWVLHFKTRNEEGMEQYLKKIWYDPRHPGSFAGAQKLYEIVKKEGKYSIGLNRIKRFLQNQDGFSLQKKVRRRGFKRRRVIAQGIDYQWEADLADVQNLS